MSRFIGNIENSQKNSSKTAVVLTNLGTPEKPTASALRNYLRAFLSDPRVVEIPRLLWMIILHGIVLRIRPAKSAKLYQKIWLNSGSPLLVISKQQQEKLASKLAKRYGEDVCVELAMRYGEPSISSTLKSIQAQGIDKMIILPLYPQYAGPTTGSTFDEIAKEFMKWRWVPSLHFISGYHEHPIFIKALVKSIEEHIAVHGKPDKLVFSYHGMPKLFCDRGDPYFDYCKKTTELVTAMLNYSDDEYIISFQSRFGKATWLQPYTDVALENLAQQGKKHVAIISPAFSADCLETLEELEKENREHFMKAGGEQYHYIPALNDRDDHIDMMESLVLPYLAETRIN